MITNNRIAELIRENRAEEIPEAIGEGAFFHMQTFTKALIDLVVTGQISRDVAGDAATNRHDFEVALEHALKREAAEQAQAEAEAAQPEPDAIPSLRLVQPTDG